jgi:hypothetical protein
VRWRPASSDDHHNYRAHNHRGTAVARYATGRDDNNNDDIPHGTARAVATRWHNLEALLDASKSRGESNSFLKKRTKNFCYYGLRCRIEPRQRHKSPLALFFRKELLPVSG